MASREKKPLGPSSKCKQKASNSNDSGVSVLSSDNKSKKASKTSPKQQQQQQLEQEVDESESTLESGTSPSSEATSSPRRRVVLKRVTGIKSTGGGFLRRHPVPTPAKTLLKAIKRHERKRIKSESGEASESHEEGDTAEEEVKGGQLLLRAKKAVKKEEDEKTIIKGRSPTATGKRSREAAVIKKNLLFNDNLKPKRTASRGKAVSAKAKVANKLKKNASKGLLQRQLDCVVRLSSKRIPRKASNAATKELTTAAIKVEPPASPAESSNHSEEEEEEGDNSSSSSPLDSSKSSYDNTIDEVVASYITIADSGEDDDKSSDRSGGKKKMLPSPRATLRSVVVKQEVMSPSEDQRQQPDEPTKECEETSSSSASESKKKATIAAAAAAQPPANPKVARKMRNGKLRAAEQSDGDAAKRATSNCQADESTAESSTDPKSERESPAVNDATESCVTESSAAVVAAETANANQDNSSKKLADEASATAVATVVIDEDLERNNNSERTSGEPRPALRSKSKSEDVMKLDKVVVQSSDSDSGKFRKDVTLANRLIDKQQPKSRRSSLNIDVKKSASYSPTTEGGDPKSMKIDQMIESIKLSIVKDIENKIESKIFAPGNGLYKLESFEMPVEEIVAPLSAETQPKIVQQQEKSSGDEVVKSSGSTQNDAENAADNSVPKLADTAKEIEKLVMGDSAEAATSKDEQGKPKDKELLAVSQGSSAEKQQSSGEQAKINAESQETSQSAAATAADEGGSSGNSKKSKEKVTRKSMRNIEKSSSSTQQEAAAAAESESSRNVQQQEGGPTTTQVPEVEKTSSRCDPETSGKETKTSSDGGKETADTELVAKSLDAPKEPEAIVVAAESSTTAEAKQQDDLPAFKQKSTSTDDGGIARTTMTSVGCETSAEKKPLSKAASSETTTTTTTTATASGASDEKKRKLRVREKQKKRDKSKPAETETTTTTTATREAEVESIVNKDTSEEPNNESTKVQVKVEDEQSQQSEATADKSTSAEEHQLRSRRSRDVKRRKDEQPGSAKASKRAKRTDNKKTDQQLMLETLLDNEVAKINEVATSNPTTIGERQNLRSTDNFRGYSEGVQQNGEEEALLLPGNESQRSKSANDIITTVKSVSEMGTPPPAAVDGNINDQLLEAVVVGGEKSETQTLEKTLVVVGVQKDSDEASTSGESSSSGGTAGEAFAETPEDKAKKESILGMLGLESLEKAEERRRAKQYTGTLKTVIRIHQKDKDKKRSRSPLKMVLKQGRAEGDGDSPEFYTIQKELGAASGLGESSSGANRKFTTNHRHSGEEENQEVASKDRQSLIIPEKSSSFSIHPGRLCADVCCYCFGKFGSLDTPMHLAQIKSDERRSKILEIERHLNKDSCLCDACYRHVDRKATQSPTNTQPKPPKQHRQLMVSKCSARECREPGKHNIKRRWLFKIKSGLQSLQLFTIDWESSQHSSMSFCVDHYAKIETFLTCALCKRRLARNHTYQIGNWDRDRINRDMKCYKIPVAVTVGTYLCKLCRYFTQLLDKYGGPESMNVNHRSFYESYRNRICDILHNNDVKDLEDDEAPHTSKDTPHLAKDKSGGSKGKSKSKSKLNSQQQQADASKSSETKSPSETASNSEKSTPEPTSKDDAPEAATLSERQPPTTVQFLNIENTVERLKKRKAMENLAEFAAKHPSSNVGVEGIVAMDKEVTLTRLPKRPRNEIPPVVQRLGSNPSISVRTLFPGEEDMNLHANVEFGNLRQVTPQGWEKCTTTIQYDQDTKSLWQELQRPYGNQSSFLRHLILLEKYYRSGDLILAPNASRNAINYSTSVQNRLISYEGPEKMDEPIMEPISIEYNNSRRLSGGYVVDRGERTPMAGTSGSFVPGPAHTSTPNTAQQQQQQQQQQYHQQQQQHKSSSQQCVLNLNSSVSIIKKPPPNLQRLNVGGSSSSANGMKKKDGGQRASGLQSGGKVLQLTESEYKRLQGLKKQKMLGEIQSGSSSGGGGGNKPKNYNKSLIDQSTFQKHLRMQQEMLNRQSKGDFEPIVCDGRTNENSPTQNLINNLNLPKSIQVTTKPSNPVQAVMPKIPRSLTVIPQTVTRPATDK